MGGLFSAPKVVPALPVAPPAAPPPAAPALTPAAVAGEARLQARERVRRGLAGTVATSARGVLDAAVLPVAGRKSLLGE